MKDISPTIKIFGHRKTVTPRPLKVLVTGAAGFVGSNLIRSLLDSGFEVFAVDNFLTGRPENIAPFERNRLFHFYKLDVTDPAFLQKFLKLHIDQIYHLACPTGVPNIKTLGEEMLLASSIGTRNVLEVARAHRARFLVTSSSEVYGAATGLFQDESYEGRVNPIGDRSAYEEGKRFTEALVIQYVRKHNLDADIARLFNAYGPGMSPKDKRVIPSFLRNLVARRPLRVFGDGSQKRTYLYIDDLISALTIIMTKGGKGEVYNVGGSSPISVLDLAKEVGKVCKITPVIKFVPHFIEDHLYRCPALSKIKRLGWRPTTSLRDGLKLMMTLDNNYSPNLASA